MNGNVISGSITSGDLGGLLAARSEVITPAINQLGQIATALTQTVNAQQGPGLDLSGQFGAAIFSVGTPQAVGSSRNTDATTASVTVTDVGALTSDSYILSYNAGAYSLKRAADGSAVALTGNGTAGNPLTAEGISIVLSGTPAAGDQFLVQPTATAASALKVVLTDPSKIAAAGAVKSASAAGNTGSAVISSGTTLDAANPNLLTPATITFSNATTYSINGGANQTYTDGGNIDFNGWEVQISGAPAAGDVFTVKSNAGGTGDNRNALAAANAQSTGVLANGTTSITGAVSALITGLGSQAQQINTAQAAQTAVNSQALANVQSVTGVNLDEEAASLLQWQQAYQASAQALAIANSLFTTLINSVNGTFS